MRVALDATYSIDPQPTGIAVYSRHLLDGLARAYAEDQFLHCYRAKQFRQAKPSSLLNVNNRLLLPPLSTFRADIFHGLNQRLSRPNTKRAVVTFHDLFVMTGDYSSPEFRARFTDQARQAADRADLIIAVSEFTAGQISSLLKVDRSRLRVISHGVPMPTKSLDRNRETLILFIGSIQSRKNVKRLVEAFETMPDSWRLTIAGAPSGFKAEEALERIERSPSRDRIRVTGYLSRENLTDLLSRASIFAFPSLDEGFGIPILEAMAWEIPVLTSNNSALAEVAGNAALLIDPQDVSAIAKGLHELASDENLRRDLIEAGKQRVKSFSWEKAVIKTYAVYKELAG